MAGRLRHDDIYLDLRGQILDGRLEQGSSLPSFNQLASRYGVSVATINKSVARLKSDGLVRAVKGAGVFVTAAESKKSKGIIGVVLPELRSSIYLEMIHGISERSDAAGFSIQFCNSGYDCAKELGQMEGFAANPQVRGLIISPGAGEHANTDFFRWLQEMNYPFVFMDRYLPEIETDSVRSDSVGGARAAVGHLIGLGHRRIAFLSAEDAIDQPWCRDRLAGYRRALDTAGIEFDPALVANNVGTDDVRRLLLHPQPPTAVFLATNRYLWRVLESAESAAKHSESRLVIAGFDEVEVPIGRLSRSEIRRYADTPLVKVIQPFAGTGRTACDLLISRIGGDRSDPITSVLTPDLVVGAAS